MVRLIEYNEASTEVRAVYDDIMKTRGTDWINNFWKALANDPSTLRRTWESIKSVMAPGALDRGRGERRKRKRGPDIMQSAGPRVGMRREIAPPKLLVSHDTESL